MIKRIRGEAVTWVLIGVVMAVIAGILAPIISKKPDTPIEQAAEAFIKKETGQDVDFSAEIKNNK